MVRGRGSSEGVARGAWALGRQGVEGAVGIGVLLGLTLCVVRQLESPVTQLGNSVASALTCSFLAGALLAAMALSVGGGRPPARASRRSSVLGALRAVALLGGTACSVLMCAVPSGGEPRAAVVAGVLMGAGAAACVPAWARWAALGRPTRIARLAAGSVPVAAGVFAAFHLAPDAASSCVVLLLSAAACLACLRLVEGADRRGSEWRWEFDERAPLRLLTAMSDRGDQLEGLSARVVGELAQVRAVFRVLWMPLSCAVFCAFIVGLTWDAGASAEWQWRGGVPDQLGVCLGALATFLAGMGLSRRRGDEACLAVLSRGVLPVCLLMVLLVPVCKGFATTPFEIGACALASTASFSALMGVAFTEAIVAARLSGTRPDAVASVMVVLLAAADVLGVVSITFLGESGRVLCLVVEAIMLASVCVSYAMRARGVRALESADGEEADDRGSAGDGARGGGVRTEEALTRRCAEIARESDLSRREEQVLRLLARGHSSRYVATELGISENTVRTHARHIYEKTGVASREELFSLVDGVPVGEDGPSRGR
ncbi:MAG: helix-turn-helix transcriptional regulator [Coriobacteriales bacterium]|jgi:DNA-binding CsgD family transcriptional regulator